MRYMLLMYRDEKWWDAKPEAERTAIRQLAVEIASDVPGQHLQSGVRSGLERKTWLIEHERRWRHDPQPALF